jgi:hypothetical protein
MGGLVAGMSADFSRAMNAGGAQSAPVMAFEITSGLSNRGEHILGILTPEIVQIQGTWNAWQRSRWVASAGIIRLQTILGADYDKDLNAAEANIWAGFSNRLIGENACYTVIDGGPAQPREASFQIGEEYFTEALRIVTNARAGTLTTAQRTRAQRLYDAALGGRASMRAWQGNWADAVADAELVPDTAVFYAYYSDATTGIVNAFFAEQFTNRYLTMQDSPLVTVENDPRIPWEKTTFSTRGGGYQSWQQMKYPNRGSDIPITHGKEMLVLRAEAALRAGDYAGMTDLLNQARAVVKMAPLTAPTTESEAWNLFKFERVATVWLEHRGFWDRARWYAEGRDNMLDGRAKCYPISSSEINSNSNLVEFR